MSFSNSDVFYCGGEKNDVKGIVRLCDYMLILHFEDKCAAELITAEPISDREGEWGRK